MNPSFIEALLEALSQNPMFGEETEDIECEVIETVLPPSVENERLEIITYG